MSESDVQIEDIQKAIRELEEKKNALIRQKARLEKPKRKKKGDYPVYYRNGDLLEYKPFNRYQSDTNQDWITRTNEPFERTMKFVDKKSRPHDYGRSVKYYLEDDLGHHYPMFPVSLYHAVIKGATISNGEISGVWQVTKKGDAYGIEWQSD